MYIDIILHMRRTGKVEDIFKPSGPEAAGLMVVTWIGRKKQNPFRTQSPQQKPGRQAMAV